MGEWYEKYKVWFPWRWLPIMVFVLVVALGEGVMRLLRKSRQW